MATFSVLLVTAAPPGQPGDAGGAFVKIDSREALLRSAELFVNRENVRQIQLCFLPEMLEQGKRKFGGHLSFSGVKIISGGPAWIDQFAAAAANVPSDCTHVLVHDAARPAVSYLDIEAVMSEAEKHPAVWMTAPVPTRLAEVDASGKAVAFAPAERFLQVLTPQAFARQRFLEIARSRQEPPASSVRLLKGSPLNVRVGSSADASLVRAMIGLLPKPKVKGPASPFEEAQW
mgnify:CR=1 FL=1